MAMVRERWRRGEGRRERERERKVAVYFYSLPSAPESQRLGQPSFTLPPGTRGVQVGEDIVIWEFEYSAWELLALETCQIFHTPGVGTGIRESKRREGERKPLFQFALVNLVLFSNTRS